MTIRQMLMSFKHANLVEVADSTVTQAGALAANWRSAFAVASNGTFTWAVGDDNNDSFGTLNWYSPTTVGAGNSYYVRFTVTGDPGPDGDVTSGTWYALSTGRVWRCNASSTKTYSSVITVDIATDSDGDSIVSSFVYTLGGVVS